MLESNPVEKANRDNSAVTSRPRLLNRRCRPRRPNPGEVAEEEMALVAVIGQEAWGDLKQRPYENGEQKDPAWHGWPGE